MHFYSVGDFRKNTKLDKTNMTEIVVISNNLALRMLGQLTQKTQSTRLNCEQMPVTVT